MAKVVRDKEENIEQLLKRFKKAFIEEKIINDLVYFDNLKI